MSKVKPMQLLSELRGKICGHSNTYFAVRYGTQYTGTICNPYTGDPTEAQVAQRERFAQAKANVAALSTEEKQTYREAFAKQRKYKTLQGYMLAQEMAKL